MKNSFYLIYRFTLFYELSIWLVLKFFQKKHFYQVRNYILLVNVFLSLVCYGVLGISFYTIFVGKVSLKDLAFLVVINGAYLGLFGLKKRLKIRYSLQPYSILNINVGSAKILKGTVSVFHLFMNSSSSQPWDEITRNKTMEKVQMAESWLIREARRFNQTVDFQNIILSDIRMEYKQVIPEFCNYYAGLPTFEKMIDANVGSSQIYKESEKNYNTVLVVHISKIFRSFACPTYVALKPNSNLPEFCVVSSHESPAVYAHEMLHLFGADDYYSEFSSIMQKYRSEFLSHSIMFNARISLDDLRVDGLTAQNVGWV